MAKQYLTIRASNEISRNQEHSLINNRATPELKQLSVEKPILSANMPSEMNVNESLKSGPFKLSTATLTGVE